RRPPRPPCPRGRWCSPAATSANSPRTPVPDPDRNPRPPRAARRHAPPHWGPMTSDERLPTIAASLDALCIVVFVTIGRRNHDESSAMSGILSTAAPFAIALFIAWVVVRAWREPTKVRQD